MAGQNRQAGGRKCAARSSMFIRSALSTQECLSNHGWNYRTMHVDASDGMGQCHSDSAEGQCT